MNLITLKSGDRNDLTFESTGLSKQLASGKISPKQVLLEIDKLLPLASPEEKQYLEAVKRQLFFREFARHALQAQTYKQPPLPTPHPFDKEWEDLKKAKTGIPIIDAAVKDLYNGTPHNRARLLLARYAIRNLNRDPGEVAMWFKQHLNDYDPVINTFNIVSAASGATFGEPYFRKSNPLTAQKTLPGANEYIKKYLGDNPVENLEKAESIINSGNELWRKRWKNKSYKQIPVKQLWPTKDPVKGKYLFTPEQVQSLNLPVKGKFQKFYEHALKAFEKTKQQTL